MVRKLSVVYSLVHAFEIFMPGPCQSNTEMGQFLETLNPLDVATYNCMISGLFP